MSAARGSSTSGGADNNNWRTYVSAHFHELDKNMSFGARMSILNKMYKRQKGEEGSNTVKRPPVSSSYEGSNAAVVNAKAAAAAATGSLGSSQDQLMRHANGIKDLRREFDARISAMEDSIVKLAISSSKSCGSKT